MSFEKEYGELLTNSLSQNSGSLNANSSLLENAINYVKQNYCKPISLKDLSTHCCVSKQHLNRCFNKGLNITPMAFVIKYKVFMACKAMRETAQSIKEISFELGFDNQCYFSKVFKRITGITPSEYKQNLTNEPDNY